MAVKFNIEAVHAMTSDATHASHNASLSNHDCTTYKIELNLNSYVTIIVCFVPITDEIKK